MAAPVKNQQLLDKMAKRIKALREAKGLTQEEFYHDTGIHISRIETAQRNMSISTVDAICKYFKISLTDFFDGM